MLVEFSGPVRRYLLTERKRLLSYAYYKLQFHCLRNAPRERSRVLNLASSISEG